MGDKVRGLKKLSLTFSSKETAYKCIILYIYVKTMYLFIIFKKLLFLILVFMGHFILIPLLSQRQGDN